MMSWFIPDEILQNYDMLEPPSHWTAAQQKQEEEDYDEQSEESSCHDISNGRKNLRKWLGKTFRVVISDGRVLVGFFNCTDKDANIVLSMCTEFLEEGKDARILGNVMIPGKHIVSIAVDMPREDVDMMAEMPPLEPNE